MSSREELLASLGKFKASLPATIDERFHRSRIDDNDRTDYLTDRERLLKAIEEVFTLLDNSDDDDYQTECARILKVLRLPMFSDQNKDFLSFSSSITLLLANLKKMVDVKKCKLYYYHCKS